MNIRDTQEKNLNESFESLDFWEQLRVTSISKINEVEKVLMNSIDSIDKTISLRLRNIESVMQNKLDDVTRQLSIIEELQNKFNEVQKKFENQLINLNNLEETLESFKEIETVNIYNPDFKSIMNLLQTELLIEAREDRSKFTKYLDNKNNLLNEHFIKNIKDMEITAQRTEKITKDVCDFFNSFAESMKKGNEAILSSEIIVGKLLYALRFVEKLSPDIQDKILKFTEEDFKALKNYIEDEKKIEVEKRESDALDEDNNYISIVQGVK